MPLANSAYPSSAVFDLIAAELQNPESKKEFIKKANGIFVFTIKNSAGETASWTVDLKNEGTVTAGESEKRDVQLMLTDADFQKLIEGKAQAQRLFMSGKLKVKGDVMKATKVEVVLKNAKPPQAKL
ncbi:SCP2 sterol-binding domain-containing protein [Pyronema domesticum]|uniref:Similar to Fatty acid-binding protein acc. no. P80547 n=1 Tax=Pyronema omphalodes (strain CBS 100304) TaxID=1076935 RepID=U4LEP1_PYROM|nr:SCP2 sterol-binding domain-containing protein [Pyronema domesticum]CCX30318.1 Similar to Fatty acid-binding protein; acc. no. P80547 [Pyronema omphalodes CBS 100304]